MASFPATPYAWAFVGIGLVSCLIPVISSNVPDGFVYTQLQKTVGKGSRAVLTCDFYGMPYAVFWKKGDDPDSAPNLFARVDGEPEYGSCVQDKSCEMGDDYSLIIKNISIADQGLYICMVSNYLGILIHNFTDVGVFALPKDPYPIINECLEMKYGEHCYLNTSIPINITCSVQRYFPTVDLFFLHDSLRYITTETLELTNTDGTKSKSISTVALLNNKPYVCVASNIHGLKKQRTAAVTLIHPDDTVISGPDTRFPNQTTSSSQGLQSMFIKIVVPTSATLLLGLFVFILCLRGCRKYGDNQLREENRGEEDPLLNPEGHLSFYEIWQLVIKTQIHGVVMGKLYDIFRELHITNNKPDTSVTQHEAYQMLCEWKNKTQKNIQREIWRKALQQAEYTEAPNDDSGSETKELSNVLNYILWHIPTIDKTNQFLRELISGQAPTIKGKIMSNDAVKSASSELLEWSNSIGDGHPFILLSLALEKAKCSPVDSTFFVVPKQLRSPIIHREQNNFTNKLTGRHCTKLTTALQPNTYNIRDIISKNNSLLFDTLLMVEEWLNNQACSDYEKRCKLDDAIIKIGRYDMKDFFRTVEFRRNTMNTGSLQEHPYPSSYQFDHESIFDDDIPQLLKLIEHLKGDNKKRLYQRMGFEPDVAGGKDTILTKKKLMEWRDEVMATKSKDQSQEEFRVLRKMLTSTKYCASTLSDEEIESVSSYIMSADQRQELITLLKIETDVQDTCTFADQLKNWIITQDPNTCRDTLRNALKKIKLTECAVDRIPAKYMYQTELARVAFDLLMEDVLPLIEALGMNQRKVRKYIQPVSKLKPEGTIGLVHELELSKGKLFNTKRDRDDFCKFALRDNGFVDISQSVYLDYLPSLSELFNIVSSINEDKMPSFLDHLDLDQDDRAECEDERGQIDKMKLMTLWKHRIRPVPYHYRLELAFALQASDLKELANDVLSGFFRTGTPNPDVLHSIFNRYDNDMVASLCNLLKVPGSTDRAVALLIDWVTKWVKGFHTHEKDHREKNDLLFSNGFGELAEEISALEHDFPLSNQGAANTSPVSERPDDASVNESGF